MFLRLMIVVAIVATAATTACRADISTPNTVSELTPRNGFWVCPSNWNSDGSCDWGAEYCTDNTFSSGAFCNEQEVLCDIFCYGDGGSAPGGATSVAYDTIETADIDDHVPDPAFGAEPINAYNYVLAHAYLKPGAFVLDYSDQNNELHYFYIEDGLFTRTNNRSNDRGSQGWDAQYGFDASSPHTAIRPGKPGEQLFWARRIPTRSKLQYLYGTSGEKAGTFSQNGPVHGRFLRVRYY